MTGPTQAHHRRMHALWGKAGVADRAERLLLTGAIVGRPLATSNDLTRAEARQVISYMCRLDYAGTLAAKARAFLDAQRAGAAR